MWLGDSVQMHGTHLMAILDMPFTSARTVSNNIKSFQDRDIVHCFTFLHTPAFRSDSFILRCLASLGLLYQISVVYGFMHTYYVVELSLTTS